MKYIGLFDNQEDIVTKEKLETKQDTITGAATSITDGNLVASRALVSDANGKVAASAVTSTELGYLDGVTSNIQTQLNSKLSTAPVTSVNNKTGAVSLTASDVSAIPSTLTGTAGQVLTKTADGQKWADAPVDENSVLLKNYNTTGIRAYAITYGFHGKSLFAACGDDGKIAISEDGVMWENISTSVTGLLLSICDVGGTGFLAIASNGDAVKSSLFDDKTWTKFTLPTSTTGVYLSVAYGNSICVAITESGGAVYSTEDSDYTEWNQTTMPSPGLGIWYAVQYYHGKFVAIATGSNIAAYSTDGITWTQTTMPSSSDWESLARSQDKVIAIPSYGTNGAYSTDGITWTAMSLPDAITWYSAAYDYTHNRFVLLGYNIIAYSVDGITWSSSVGSANRVIVYGGDALVAVNESSEFFISTDSGRTWQSSVNQLQYPDGTDIHDRVREALDIPEPESEVFICTVTGNDTDGYTCDKTYNEILEAYNAGKICIAEYLEAHTWTHICYLVQFYSVQQLRNFTFSNITGEQTISSNQRSIRITIHVDNTVYVNEYVMSGLPRATKITLTVAGWDSTAKTQSVTVSGVSSSATSQEIRVMPADASKTSAYVSCGVSCIAQASKKLTFACDTVPTTAIDVYVVMQSLNFQS